MSPQRKEQLLRLAEDLMGRLESARVPALERHRGDARPDAVGLPAACLGQLTAFLERERDLERFRRFVALLDQLDPLLAQNQQNPKADFKVLRQEVERFAAEQPEMPMEEWLYVLSWARRLLPARQQRGGRRPPPGGSAPRWPTKPRRPLPEPPTGGFGQLGDALQKWKKQ